MEKELAAALEADKDKRIVPVLLDEHATENWGWPLIANRQAIDLTVSDDQDLIDRLVRASSAAKAYNLPQAEPHAPAGARRGYSIALAMAAAALVLYYATQTSDAGVPGWLLSVGAAVLGFGSGFLLRSGNK